VFARSATAMVEAVGIVAEEEEGLHTAADRRAQEEELHIALVRRVAVAGREAAVEEEGLGCSRIEACARGSVGVMYRVLHVY
jgi:hypothetical protein